MSEDRIIIFPEDEERPEEEYVPKAVQYTQTRAGKAAEARQKAKQKEKERLEQARQEDSGTGGALGCIGTVLVARRFSIYSYGHSSIYIN